MTTTSSSESVIEEEDMCTHTPARHSHCLAVDDGDCSHEPVIV